MTEYKMQEYTDAMRKIAAFNLEYKRNPNYVTMPDGKLVYEDDYKTAKENVLKFVRDNDRCPNTVEMKTRIPEPTKQTATTIYAELTVRPYEYYYNSRYTRTQREQRYNNKQSMNCTDYSLYLYRRLKAAGYEVMAARGEVLCNDGKWYGHVWLEVRGGEFKNWVFYDSVSATKTKRPINQLCCVKGMRNRKYNPKWFMDLL